MRARSVVLVVSVARYVGCCDGRRRACALAGFVGRLYIITDSSRPSSCETTITMGGLPTNQKLRFATMTVMVGTRQEGAAVAISPVAALTRQRRQFMPWRLPVTARFTVHDHRIMKTLCGVLGLLCLFRPSWLAIASPLSIEHYSSTEKLTEVARNLIPNNDGELPSLRACVSFCFITPAESATAHVVSLIRRESCCKRSLLFLLRSQSDVNSLSISSVVHGQLLTCVD
jgi:hypothetical protein